MKAILSSLFIIKCSVLLAQQGNSVKSAVYTIPVVFHVLHQNGNENISDAQIEDAIRILNENYSATNTSVSTIHADFQGMQADAKIEFKLAKIAPNGSFFNGITRTFSSLVDSVGQFDQKVQAVIAGNDTYQGIWPESNYFNIVVCTPSLNEATSSNIDGNNGMEHNSVFVLHSYVGSIGTGSTWSTKDFLTYEVGKWLKLNNTFGAKTFQLDPTNCSQDDGLADTPNCIWVAICDLNNFACGDRAMTENFMALSYCMKFFTQEQVGVMHQTLNDTLSNYYNLWQPENLTLLGLDEIDDNFPSNLLLYPNPSSNDVTLSFDLLHFEEIVVEVVDMLGSTVQTVSFLGTEGDNKLNLNIDSLNKGVYCVKLRTTSSQKRMSFIKL